MDKRIEEDWIIETRRRNAKGKDWGWEGRKVKKSTGVILLEKPLSIFR